MPDIIVEENLAGYWAFPRPERGKRPAYALYWTGTANPQLGAPIRYVIRPFGPVDTEDTVRGAFVPVRHPDYEYAYTLAEFTEKAARFFDPSAEKDSEET
jgi:hypothetical protein